jgi:hypothetical protein
MKILTALALAIVFVSPALFADSPYSITPTAGVSPINTPAPAFTAVPAAPSMYHSNYKTTKTASHAKANKIAATASKAAVTTLTAVTVTVSNDMRGDVAKDNALAMKRKPAAEPTMIIMPLETRAATPAAK